MNSQKLESGLLKILPMCISVLQWKIKI